MKTFLQSAIDLFNAPAGRHYHYIDITVDSQWQPLNAPYSLYRHFREDDNIPVRDTPRESQVYMLLFIAAERGEL